MREVAVHFSLFGVAAILVVLSANFYSWRIEPRSPTPATVAPAGIALSAIASLLEGPSVMWNKGMLDEESLCTQVGCSFEDQVQESTAEEVAEESQIKNACGGTTHLDPAGTMHVCVYGVGHRLSCSRITRFHKSKFKIFIFCDIQFRSARVY